MHPDVDLALALAGHPAVLRPLALALSAFGGIGGIWIVLGLWFLWRPKDRRQGVALLLGLVLAAIAADWILKPLVGRPRPYLVLGRALLTGPPAAGPSFPSGHSSVAFAGAAVWARRRAEGPLGRWGTVAGYVYAAAVAWSRVYLGDHWSSDVVAGALLGLVLAPLATFLARRLIPGESRIGGAV